MLSLATLLLTAWLPSHAVAAYPVPNPPAGETVRTRRRRVAIEPVGDAARLVDTGQAALFRWWLRLSRGGPQGARGRRAGGDGSARAAGTRSEVRYGARQTTGSDEQMASEIVDLACFPHLLVSNRKEKRWQWGRTKKRWVTVDCRRRGGGISCVAREEDGGRREGAEELET